MAFLLDTNIAIWIGDRHPAIGQQVAALSGPQRLSIVTVVELEGGIVATGHHAAVRKAALATMLALFDAIPLDGAVATAYSRIIHTIGFSRPRILDRLIAATAIVHDLTLITTNGPDFQNIPGLKLEIWPRPDQ